MLNFDPVVAELRARWRRAQGCGATVASETVWGIPVVRLNGELDLATASEFRDRLVEACAVITITGLVPLLSVSGTEDAAVGLALGAGTREDGHPVTRARSADPAPRKRGDPGTELRWPGQSDAARATPSGS